VFRLGLSTPGNVLILNMAFTGIKPMVSLHVLHAKLTGFKTDFFNTNYSGFSV